MIDNGFTFEDCPVGKLNNQEIKHTAESLSKDLQMAIERLESKMDSMNQKMDTNFDSLNKKIDKLDKKLQGVDDIKGYVRQEIENSSKDKVFNFVKWVVVCLIGGGAITVFGKWLTALLIK